MLTRSVLCVASGGEVDALRATLAARGWEVAVAVDLEAATRMQSQRRHGVGLLACGRGLDAPACDIAACLGSSEWMEWLAVCDPVALESPELRDLVLCNCFAHLAGPLDIATLEQALGLALQRAQLRWRHASARLAADNLGMVGQGPAMTRLRQQIRRVAATDAPVLIGGESGSGKELAARAVHQCSQRAGGPFVAVNCGAISPSLIQSELFGHERGAFTGASAERRGLIETASGGTIFLDEIGDLPLELQTNLLRFLQEKTISRVGAVRSMQVDVRVVAASHVDLAEAVAVGRFRDDLFYRLNVLSLELLPLRRRMEDVPLLAEHFFARCVAKGRARVKGFSRQAVASMMAHSWPGNVRELYNRVQRAVVMTESRLIEASDLGLNAAQQPARLELDAARTIAERDAICLTLIRVGRNVTRAARELGVSRMTLYRLMDKHSIVLNAPQGLYQPAYPSAPGEPASSADNPLRTAPSSVAGYGPST